MIAQGQRETRRFDSRNSQALPVVHNENLAAGCGQRENCYLFLHADRDRRDKFRVCAIDGIDRALILCDQVEIALQHGGAVDAKKEEICSRIAPGRNAMGYEQCLLRLPGRGYDDGTNPRLAPHYF